MKQIAKLLERFDWVLITAALTLTAVGLVTIYGIGVSQEPPELFTVYKQFFAILLGLAAASALCYFDFRHLRSYGFVLYASGALLLILVLFLGHTVRNTTGWFRLGGLSFQPVEVAKITLAAYLAALYARHGHGRLNWRGIGLGFVATVVYAGLVLLQPDFGSAMVIFGIWLAMSVFAGLPRSAWIILPVAAALAGLLLWNFGLKPYQRDRILTFLDPAGDPRGAGYNAAQARIAIGSGGWLGKGIGEGSQARLRFLPEAATDFVIAVVGEELGFVGVGVVLGLFLLVLSRFLIVAYESEDDYASLLLVGLAAVFLIHMVVNVGMNLGIMPITGIPLPFVSAAASYIVVAFLSIGLAESVAVRRRAPAQ